MFGSRQNSKSDACKSRRIPLVGLDALVMPDTAHNKDTTGAHLDNSLIRMNMSPHCPDNALAFLAGYSLGIFRSDTFNLGAMSSFTVTRVAGYHTIFSQEMQVSVPALRLLLCLHLHALVLPYLLRSQLKCRISY
jgi:hypothetical protein